MADALLAGRLERLGATAARRTWQVAAAMTKVVISEAQLLARTTQRVSVRAG